MRLPLTMICLLALACAWPCQAAHAEDAGTPVVSQASTSEDDTQDAEEIVLEEASPDDSVQDEDAGDSGDDTGEIDLGQVDVQGLANATPAGAALTAVSEVITAGEIEDSGAATVSEVLSREAGFTVNDTFAGSEVAFQGLPSKFTTVLIDGQRIPGHIFERVDFSQLPVSNIERIEIIRGPQTAAFGSDSAGVVVNLVTRNSTGLHGMLKLGIGSLGYNQQYASVGDNDGRQSWMLGFERQLRESYDLDSFMPDTDGDSFHQYDIFGKYERTRGRNHLRLQLDSFLEDAVGLSFAPPDQTRMNETFTRRWQGLVAYDMNLGSNKSLSISQNYGSYYHNLHRYYTGYEETSAIDTGFTDTLWDTQLKYQQYKKDYILNAGLERNWNELESDRIGGDGKEQSQQFSAYTTMEYFLGPRWTVTWAARYDQNDLFGDKLSPKASIQYKINPEAGITAALGRGQRYPSLRERYYEFASPYGYTVLGNESLRPESTLSYNIDYRQDTRQGYLRLGLFRHNISNMIVFGQISAAPQVFQTQNIGSARSAGMQLSAERSWALGCDPSSTRRIGTGYDLTWIADSRDIDLGTRLVNSPEFDHRWHLFYRQPAFSAEVSLQRTLSRYFDRENNTRAPAFSTMDISVSRELAGGEWQIALLNALDERDGKYGPEPGREVRVVYMYKF